MRDYKLYLSDILESAKKILDYTKNITYDEFMLDSKTIDAVVRNLEIIGEAANKIPEKITALYPEIPWRSMIGMRNLLVHEYFGVSIKIIWETIKRDIPDLIKKIENINL
ncbi:HepT-like ribonuclease domain-containing protein [Carboxydothermus hydrogenoformans]|uniref:DUF86 domain-containing protein n=1 Tax=Carboxydothermus hydrogenoformans (strain ATCC BAA-161 / DSM 6008 / Z-2901) TaxID=246194 RepID=Q3A956_CARHZ|nr:DUF86 domain-containing protein [Carboxydothermus hydrogenoformans]ABB15567.1 conserved hypothetical protein [Carboxydothermus hydrogenoformans Z-2901]